MNTEKHGVCLLCKRAGNKGKFKKVRRKTHNELSKNRIRRGGRKCHRRIFCDYREKPFFQIEVTQIDIQVLKGHHANFESHFLSKQY